MKNLSRTAIAVAAMLLLPMSSLAGDAHASGSYHAKSGHAAIPGQTPDYIRKVLKRADAIGLSDKQRQQVGALLVQAESQAATAHAEAEITVAAFRSQLHAGTVSDKDVNAYTARMGELRAVRLAANLKASVAVSRLLSDEQKSSLHGGRNQQGGNK
ncbi:MAG: hypothetical protein CO187_08770 [Zetaproteobacteria bacterium CG_4_9_14_3_um_filter_53_7]|nr:MAG: hypothetical protein CO187_08770 [Zetaproteobacteria bacterium CG_4_9_14_3_um_filter_53_7]